MRIEVMVFDKVTGSAVVIAAGGYLLVARVVRLALRAFDVVCQDLV